MLIIFDTTIVCIENKVDSRDRIGQLSTYRKIVKKDFPTHNPVFVYLTPLGEQSLDSDERNHYLPYSYKQLVEHGERVLEIQGNSLNTSVFQYLSDYFSIIKRELMMSDESNLLANKLYKNHRTLFDFVFENKSDLSTELLPFFVEKVKNSDWKLGSKNKGYVRFLTNNLYDIIPRKGNGFPLKENFLFEIDFFWYKNKIVFKTIISPGDDKIVDLLNKSLLNVNGHKIPKGKKWLTHFQINFEFEKDNKTNLDDLEIVDFLDKNWAKIEDIVSKVEIEILKIGDELKNLGDESSN